MLSFADKLLPTQPAQLINHKGTRDEAVQAIADMCLSYAADPKAAFHLYNHDTLPSIEEMASSPLTLSMLSMLVRITGAREILEVGTFVGLGAMTMAKAAVPSAHVVTIEIYPEAAKQAQRHFAANGLADKITLVQGDALQILASRDFHQRSRWFDFVFIDGGKQNYVTYLDMVDSLLYPGALIVIDDVFFNGDVFNPTPTTAKGHGARDTLYTARVRHNYERLLLPIGDGVLVLRKK